MSDIILKTLKTPLIPLNLNVDHQLSSKLLCSPS